MNESSKELTCRAKHMRGDGRCTKVINANILGDPVLWDFSEQLLWIFVADPLHWKHLHNQQLLLAVLMAACIDTICKAWQQLRRSIFRFQWGMTQLGCYHRYLVNFSSWALLFWFNKHHRSVQGNRGCNITHHLLSTHTVRRIKSFPNSQSSRCWGD